ncbi:hypothetical protein Hanom_Chr05g00399861 [Helianthus anomalus]
MNQSHRKAVCIYLYFLILFNAILITVCTYRAMFQFRPLVSCIDQFWYLEF